MANAPTQDELIGYRQEIVRIQSRLITIDRALAAAGVPVETPVVAPPTPAVEFDEVTGHMKGGRDLGYVYIEPVVPQGTARTVYLATSGHTLSIARPDKGEKFMGYIQRVSDQATAGLEPNAYQKAGALAAGADWLFDQFGGFKADGSNWPSAADRFFNGEAYGDKAGAPPVVAVPGATTTPTTPTTPPVELPPGEEQL